MPLNFIFYSQVLKCMVWFRSVVIPYFFPHFLSFRFHLQALKFSFACRTFNRMCVREKQQHKIRFYLLFLSSHSLLSKWIKIIAMTISRMRLHRFGNVAKNFFLSNDHWPSSLLFCIPYHSYHIFNLREIL